MSVSLITGGAGFVGTNLADRLASEGRRVRVLDSLTRPGVERNARWLRREHRDRVELLTGDVRDARAVREAVRGVDDVYHLAAQVAVTTSLEDPRSDFDVNLGGTLTLLEELRRLAEPPPVFFTSTNKVYGSLDDVDLAQTRGRWEPADARLRTQGIDESRPLDFHTPYGCSKGAADQYVLDYARSFGLRAVVVRMSCIYGPHQHGTEDQGWVAHFLLRALSGEPITIYGDGAQVRDLLYVEDLVDAFVCARELADELAGRAFNLGGGSANTASLLEVLEAIEELTGDAPCVRLAPARRGDQRWYVSDTSRFRAATGWGPEVSVERGLERLHAWLAPPVRRATAVPA